MKKNIIIIFTYCLSGFVQAAAQIPAEPVAQNPAQTVLSAIPPAAEGGSLQIPGTVPAHTAIRTSGPISRGAACVTEQPIAYRDFLDKVWRQNLAYAAEKLKLEISGAAVKAAGLFNDPEISFEYANNDDRTMQMGQGFSAELSKTFSPGKRSARIDLAGSEKDLTECLLEDYFRNLRADATIAYLEAIKQSELYAVKLNSYDNIRQLALGDSIKFALGKITKVDATQSSLEAGMIYNGLLQARTELYNAYTSLGLVMGIISTDTLYTPRGSLRTEKREFHTGSLLGSALNNRTDLAAALKNTEVARKALKLTRRERNPDFDITLGFNYNTAVRNELAPAPEFNGITIGLAIPLKFSNLNKGEVRSAQIQVKQAELYYKQAELEVQNSVLQNLQRYLSLEEQVRRYDTGLLESAGTVIEGKIYSYNRGETSLLEVLNAQRTYDELRTAYIETLYRYAVSLVELERSAGIWDISIE